MITCELSAALDEKTLSENTQRLMLRALAQASNSLDRVYLYPHEIELLSDELDHPAALIRADGKKLGYRLSPPVQPE